MQVHCAPSCRTCDLLSIEKRCPFDKNAPGVWGPGDLDMMFERITTDPIYLELYNTTVLSSPAQNGPWLVQLENFLSPEECERLIYHGHLRGYDTSFAVKRLPDGTVENIAISGRTSQTAWCEDACLNDPLTNAVVERIENLTGIPRNNSEALQLLKYEVNQFYHQHHDYLKHQLDKPQSVRILTVFLYLNDVEAGGETRFTFLKKSVAPKRGRVVLWPSVYNDDPFEKDGRTLHESLDVKAGVKYGANAWIHQRDYMTPNRKGCTD